MKNEIQLGDKVELLREEILDDNIHKYKCTRLPKGTIMMVKAITPKVCMIKGEGYDSKPYFLNLVQENHINRVRTNFCNVKKIA